MEKDLFREVMVFPALTNLYNAPATLFLYSYFIAITQCGCG